jgi:hypothetical protein
VINCDGVSENAFHEAIRAYPNPAGDYISVEGTVQGELIRIIDMTGRTIIVMNASEGDTRCNISGLAAGLYDIVIGTDEQRSIVRIIKY